MKKIICVMIVLICVIGLVACSIQNENNEVSFVGAVSEIREKSILVTVTDGGNSNLAVGTTVDVSTKVTSANGCPTLTQNDYVRISFNGDVLEINPPALGTVFSIQKMDDAGKSITD